MKELKIKLGVEMEKNKSLDRVLSQAKQKVESLDSKVRMHKQIQNIYHITFRSCRSLNFMKKLNVCKNRYLSLSFFKFNEKVQH